MAAFVQNSSIFNINLISTPNLKTLYPRFTNAHPLSPISHGRRNRSNLQFNYPSHKRFNVMKIHADYNDGGDGSGGSGGGGSDGSGSSGGGGGDERSGGGGGDDGNDSSSIFSWYLRALDKYPVATKAITSAFLTLIGDLTCQFCFDKVTTLDAKRTFVFTFLGLALVGPTLHFWYLSVSRLVTIPGASGTFVRLLLDQFVFSPIFIGVFLSSLVTLEGKPYQVMPKLKQEWFPALVANWQLWIPFQFFNFQFVPQKFQVLAANFVALAWNVILSYKAHKEIAVK